MEKHFSLSRLLSMKFHALRCCCKFHAIASKAESEGKKQKFTLRRRTNTKIIIITQCERKLRKKRDDDVGGNTDDVLQLHGTLT